MRIYLLPHEKLLIEITGWGIVQDNEGSNMIYTTHQCLGEASKEGGRNEEGIVVYGEGVWHEGSRDGKGDPECAYCHEPVPDSIQTLIYIHGWER